MARVLVLKSFSAKFTCQAPILPKWKYLDGRCLRKKEAQWCTTSAILQDHYQAIIWNNDTVPKPEVPSPEHYVWNLEGDKLVPIMTKQLPAPKSVTQFIRCDRAMTKCETDKFTCSKAELECTDMCGCCDIREICDNAEQVKAINMHTDGEDEKLQDDEFMWIMCGYFNLINYHFLMFVNVFTLHWMLLVHCHNIYYDYVTGPGSIAYQFSSYFITYFRHPIWRPTCWITNNVYLSINIFQKVTFLVFLQYLTIHIMSTSQTANK